MGTERADHGRQRLHGLRTVAASVVEQNDVAAPEPSQHVAHDGRDPGPQIVLRIDRGTHLRHTQALRDEQGAHLAGGRRRRIRRVRGTEHQRIVPGDATDHPRGSHQLQADLRVGDGGQIRMRECVATDGEPVGHLLPHEPRVRRGVAANQEERGGRMQTAERREHLRGPHGVGPVVERERHLAGATTPPLQTPAPR